MTPAEIDALIAAKGLTVRAIAERIGVSRQAIEQVRDGHTTGATARFAFAMAIGEDPEAIWPREDKPRAEPPTEEVA